MHCSRMLKMLRWPQGGWLTLLTVSEWYPNPTPCVCRGQKASGVISPDPPLPFTNSQKDPSRYAITTKVKGHRRHRRLLQGLVYSSASISGSNGPAILRHPLNDYRTSLRPLQVSDPLSTPFSAPLHHR